jgi:hypothetical protein
MWAAYRSPGAGTFKLTRVSRDQYAQTRKRAVDRYSLLPGDLLFFSSSSSWQSIHHVAMYAGDGMMVEAPRTGLNVRLVPVRWTRLFGATRIYGSIEGVVQGPDLGAPDPEKPSDHNAPNPKPPTTKPAPKPTTPKPKPPKPSTSKTPKPGGSGSAEPSTSSPAPKPTTSSPTTTPPTTAAPTTPGEGTTSPGESETSPTKDDSPSSTGSATKSATSSASKSVSASASAAAAAKSSG